MDNNLSAFLNFSRWVAAFLVVTSHVRHLILVDWKAVQHQTILYKAVYFLTGLGHEVVIVFFVISGYLVGGITWARWKKNGPDLRIYSDARISRIYTVLLPALFLGYILDSVGLKWFNASELYTNSSKYHTISLNGNISESLGLSVIVGNVMMLQTVFVRVLGSNGPLWSLASEWWYYCLFALGAAALTGEGKSRIYCGGLALILASLLPGRLVLWGIIWFAGIVANAWVMSKRWRPHPTLGVGLLVIGLVLSRLSHNTENVDSPELIWISFSRDFMLSLCFAVALVSINRSSFEFPSSRTSEWLADFSYSTYCFHFPAMLFIVAVGYEVFGFKFQAQPSIYSFTYVAATVAALYAYSFGMSRLTERYTGRVRGALGKV